ncbi:hypothetical protein [Streptomyces sp. NPDC006997]|uniref:hypothetical protein n=1 Tax=Streptomyces sp. NPDC006997 TaxID=3155356 RepID=UPI0033C04849
MTAHSSLRRVTLGTLVLLVSLVSGAAVTTGADQAVVSAPGHTTVRTDNTIWD